jgi:hypothetical protein
LVHPLSVRRLEIYPAITSSVTDITMLPSTPLALSPALPSELLTYILTHQTYPTTLIICQSRAAFLTSLLKCVHHVVPKHHAPPSPSHAHAQPEHNLGIDEDTVRGYNDEQVEGQPEIGTEEESQKEHHLLIPTLHQLASSRCVNLVFIPSVSHLRAFLTVGCNNEREAGGERPQQFTKSGTKPPLLVVYGLIENHHHTSEWSAQGLSVSLSALIDRANIDGKAVVLIEELDWAFKRDSGGMKRREHTRKMWEERVPMLNGSVRRQGIDSGDSGWNGRTVEVGRVLGRWFRFRRGDWEIDD